MQYGEMMGRGRDTYASVILIIVCGSEEMEAWRLGWKVIYLGWLDA